MARDKNDNARQLRTTSQRTVPAAARPYQEEVQRSVARRNSKGVTPSEKPTPTQKPRATGSRPTADTTTRKAPVTQQARGKRKAPVSSDAQGSGTEGSGNNSEDEPDDDQLGDTIEDEEDDTEGRPSASKRVRFSTSTDQTQAVTAASAPTPSGGPNRPTPRAKTQVTGSLDETFMLAPVQRRTTVTTPTARTAAPVEAQSEGQSNVSAQGDLTPSPAAPPSTPVRVESIAPTITPHGVVTTGPSSSSRPIRAKSAHSQQDILMRQFKGDPVIHSVATCAKVELWAHVGEVPFGRTDSAVDVLHRGLAMDALRHQGRLRNRFVDESLSESDNTLLQTMETTIVRSVSNMRNRIKTAAKAAVDAEWGLSALSAEECEAKVTTILENREYIHVDSTKRTSAEKKTYEHPVIIRVLSAFFKLRTDGCNGTIGTLYLSRFQPRLPNGLVAFALTAIDWVLRNYPETIRSEAKGKKPPAFNGNEQVMMFETLLEGIKNFEKQLPKSSQKTFERLSRAALSMEDSTTSSRITAGSEAMSFEGDEDEDASEIVPSPRGCPQFTPGGKSLIFTAGDRARVKVFTSRVPSTPPTPPRGTSATVIAPEPVALTHDFAASAAQPLPDGRILFTQNSFNGPNNAFVLNPKTEEGDKITRITNFGSEVLDKRELAGYEDLYFTGADGVKIQGWAVKPYGWREGQKAQWPALLLIHGGPQGAWEDQWSTRWNPQVFAQHGYFVIAINPTGSTTFGQDLTDAIKGEWGGKPMVDLQKGFEYALETYPEIDKSRTAAAGASYGGYAVNWIAGNQEKYGFNFKALVTHDGLFDTRAGGYSTEELFFWAHEFGGLPFEEDAIKTAEKWNPSLHVSKWKTPHLVIHGSKDYRLTETDGLSVFTALQIRNVPSRLVIFPDENHWVLKPANSLKWHEEVFGWIDKYIG